jgi:hypothetical protein
VLTDAAVEAFIADGFTVVRQAFSGQVAGACADRIWLALAERGIRQDDPSTWTEPVVSVACPEGGPFVEAGAGDPARPPAGQHAEILLIRLIT